MRIDPTSVMVSWSPISLVEARGFVLSYTIVIVDDETGKLMAFKTVAGDQTSVTINGLSSDLSYQVQVWANTSAGAGVRTEPIQVQRFVKNNTIYSYNSIVE